MTDKRPDGFYWVRPAEGMDWEPAQLLDGFWGYLGSTDDMDHQNPREIGPRIEPPPP